MTQTNQNEELSGLELRKAACEAAGMDVSAVFKIFYIGSPMTARDRAFDSINEAQQYIDSVDEREPPQHKSHGKVEIRSCERDLPAIESDSAISEPMFLEWCEKRGYFWSVTQRRYAEPPEWFQCFLWTRSGVSERYEVETYGATPSEARARAIVAVAALELGKKIVVKTWPGPKRRVILTGVSPMNAKVKWAELNCGHLVYRQRKPKIGVLIVCDKCQPEPGKKREDQQ
jgi:hypothetical protein